MMPPKKEWMLGYFTQHVITTTRHTKSACDKQWAVPYNATIGPHLIDVSKATRPFERHKSPVDKEAVNGKQKKNDARFKPHVTHEETCR
jgi:hypothetical protein